MSKIVSNPGIRTRNDDGQIRKLRSDAQIGNVRSIKEHAPDLITGMGAKTEVGELRSQFGGKDVGEIVHLPKAQRAVVIQQRLAALGLDNKAAEAVMTAALMGGLGDKVVSGDSYYVQIGGKKLDRELLEGFVLSLKGNVVSADDAKKKIVPEMIDGGGMTATETATYLFAMQHLPVTDKALREQLIPALREATGSPVKHLGPNEAGFDFMELYDHLQTHGRLQDLYAAKTDMSSAEMLAMWDNGITLADLDKHLESALAPKSMAGLKDTFGAEEVKNVQSWLKSEGDTKTLKRLAGGKISAGEMQNLIYGSWQMENTPYDASYKAKFEPMPITAASPHKALGAFVSGLEKSIESHDWKGLMKAFNAENRAGQKEIGVTSDAQYIAEGLGLHMVDNTLPGDIQKFSSLNNIASVKLGKELDAGGEITGTATLKDGSKLNVNIYVVPKGAGFEIEPAVG